MIYVIFDSHPYLFTVIYVIFDSDSDLILFDSHLILFDGDLCYFW